MPTSNSQHIVIISWQNNWPWRVVVAIFETKFLSNVFFRLIIEVSLNRYNLKWGFLRHPFVVMLSQVVCPVFATDASNTNEEDQDGSFAEIFLHRVHRASIFWTIECLHGEYTTIFNLRFKATRQEQKKHESNESHVAPSCVCRGSSFFCGGHSALGLAASWRTAYVFEPRFNTIPIWFDSQVIKDKFTADSSTFENNRQT